KRCARPRSQEKFVESTRNRLRKATSAAGEDDGWWYPPAPDLSRRDRLTTNAPRPIADVARDLGIDPKNLVPYGDDKAKIRLAARETGRPPGKLILVSALTPTDAGEGETTTSIGLAQGMARIGERVCLALREPSLGPTFGMKGG